MPKILIIDAQPCVRKLISQELIQEGHQVESFANPRRVMEHLQSTLPDLVLLEPNSHGPQGWELLRYIKNQTPDLPVLIVTACVSFLDHPCVKLADEFFVKGFDFSKLKKKIANLLARKSAAEAGSGLDRHSSKLGVPHLDWLGST
jgi:DNA-binding response OmpR family regulator